MADRDEYGTSGGYTGPPGTGQGGQYGQPEPQYPTQYPGQPGAAYPGGQYSPYPAPYGAQGFPPGQQPGAGYPPVPYPGGYPQGYGYPPPYGFPRQPGSDRPGLVLASSVLAYINAGLLILAGALVLFGVSVVHDLERTFNSDSGIGSEFVVAGIANLVAGGLLIAGSVNFSNRSNTGRILASVGNVIVLGAAVFWMTQFNDEYDNGDDGFLFWGVLFVTLSVLTLAFSFVPTVNKWLSGAARS